MLPTPIGHDSCRLSEQWRIAPRLADMLVELVEWAEETFKRTPSVFGLKMRWPGTYIISGSRSRESNRASGGVRDSRHLDCPATAADLRIGGAPGMGTEPMWALMGNKWKSMGGRWGGDFNWSGSPRPNPREWNHFDLG